MRLSIYCVLTDEFNVIETDTYFIVKIIRSLLNFLMKFMSHSKWIKLVIMNQYWLTHINVKNVIVFITMRMKIYYDEKHQPQFFSVEDMINLHLHCDYILFSLIRQNKKLSQQFVGPLHIREWIEQLVYWLDLLNTWKIHDVMFITHLEPVFIKNNNSYYWSHSMHSDTIIITSDTEPEWKLKQLLCKQTYQKDCDYITEYLAHWLKYKLKYNS